MSEVVTQKDAQKILSVRENDDQMRLGRVVAVRRKQEVSVPIRGQNKKYSLDMTNDPKEAPLKPYILGVCGATFSGKSLIFKYIIKKLLNYKMKIDHMNEVNFLKLDSNGKANKYDVTSYDWAEME